VESWDGDAIANGFGHLVRLRLRIRQLPVHYEVGVYMFIRLVVGADQDDHRILTGLVTEAKLLQESGVLSANEEAVLAEHYRWLNENLPCPPYSRSDWPKFVAAWFKDSAVEPIRRLRAIGALLEEHGLQVRMLRSRNPGKVHYEDDYQVVVHEWNSL